MELSNLFPFLKIGVIFAILHCFGNFPVRKDMFMIMVKGVLNLSLNSFKIRFGTEFGPTVFVVLILPITLIVSFSFTGCSQKDDKFLFFK